MEQAVSYAAMTEDDIDGVLSIQAACNLSHWHRASYLAALNDPNSRVFVAKVAQLPVGFILTRLITIESLCEILNIGVIPSYKRRKIGKGLLLHLLSNLDGQISRVWLEVREGNLPAIGFYENQGFKMVGKRKNFYRDPVENALLMEKDLCVGSPTVREGAFSGNK